MSLLSDNDKAALTRTAFPLTAVRPRGYLTRRSDVSLRREDIRSPMATAGRAIKRKTAKTAKAAKTGKPGKAARPGAARFDPPSLEDGYFVREFVPYILNQVANTMNQRFKQALKAFGLSISQWRVLAALTTGTNLSLTELVKITVIDQPTLSRIIDQLVERGLVTRVPRQGDGRFNAIALAAGGTALLEQAWPLAWAHAEQAVAVLTRDEQAQLRRMLQRMLNSLK
jgi:DNA-binding MarR family transcriptional regulator